MGTRQSLRDYAAGALVANAPSWLLSLLFPYLRTVTGYIFTALAIFFTAMAGGVAAGYLVARRANSEQVKVGLSTGLFSYTIYALFLTFTGVRGGAMDDIPSLTGFVIGGATGARLWETKHQRRMDQLHHDQSMPRA